MPIDEIVLGNVFGGGGYFKGKTLKSRFLCHFFFLLSSFLSLSLFLTCGFCLDRVLTDVTNGFANYNF